ncbi:MAG: flagellar export protein FliJ [Thermoleophilia bacterium]|nr:flagellar export protein FliJ [Thermoleophilia bacterium]
MAKKAFKFRLQRLLEIRVMREKQAQQELLVRRDRVRQEQAQLQVLIDQEAALIARMSPPPGTIVDIADIRLCEHAAKLKREEQDAQQTKIQQAERAVNEQVIILRQAGIDVKALEKLREKQLAEFMEEMLREEAVFLDDLASQQYIRQGKHAVMLKHERANQASVDAALAALADGTS